MQPYQHENVVFSLISIIVDDEEQGEVSAWRQVKTS
jgi:hypothetical protein